MLRGQFPTVLTSDFHHHRLSMHRGWRYYSPSSRLLRFLHVQYREILARQFSQCQTIQIRLVAETQARSYRNSKQKRYAIRILACPILGRLRNFNRFEISCSIKLMGIIANLVDRISHLRRFHDCSLQAGTHSFPILESMPSCQMPHRQ